MPAKNRNILQFSNQKQISLWVILWSLLGLLQTFRLYYAYNVFDDGIISWQKSALWAFTEWYLWGLLAVLIYKSIIYLQNEGYSLRVKSFWFVIGLIILPAIHLYFYSVIWFLTRNIFPVNIGTSYTNINDIFLGSYLGKVNDNSIAYFLIVAAIYAFTYYKKLYQEQNRLAEINRQLAEAKLEHLKTQLQPHFLFNTLNSITALIHSDPEKADLMTTRLSDLLRISLNAEKIQEIPLKEELRILAIYLDIQKIRFEDRLKIEYKIAENSKEYLLPFLILQPIVENSIKHGISQYPEQGLIKIESFTKNDSLVITVKNSGPALSEDMNISLGTGFGIASIKTRLSQLYETKASIQILNDPPFGVKVILTLPLRET